MEPCKRSVPLATGIAIHAGLSALLQRGDSDRAMAEALRAFDSELAGRQLDLDENEDMNFVAQEQRMLTMALVAAYARSALVDLLGEYVVVEVEQEESWAAADWLTFMARVDALLYSKETGDFIIQSFKSAARWGKQQDDQNRHDFQGISEGMACEARLVARWRKLRSDNPPQADSRLDGILRNLPDPPRVNGIRMEFLIKGQRTEWPEGSGRWISPSPLIYGYRLKNPVGEQRYAWRQNWKDSYGKGHRLDYRTWERFAVWECEEFGSSPEQRVIHWIGMLEGGLQQEEGAGDALRNQFVLPEVYYRSIESSRSWARQMLCQESDISKKPVDVTHPESFIGMLDDYWPMNRSRCDDYGRPCEFASLCHGGEARMRDPIATGDFVARQPNHPQEEEGEGINA